MAQHQKSFYLRRLTSLSTAVGFVLLAVTGVVLFIEPHGRVAYWRDWRLFGLNKDQWDGMHMAAAVLFLVAGTVHLVHNWRTIVNYLGLSRRRRRPRGRELLGALALGAVVVVGAITAIPPFANLFALNEAAKSSWAAVDEAADAPFGHAELASLKALCGRLGIDPQKALERLRGDALVVEDEHQTLKGIAEANNRRPAEVFAVMRGDDPIVFGRGRPGKGRGLNRHPLAGDAPGSRAQPGAAPLAADPLSNQPLVERTGGGAARLGRGAGNRRTAPGRGLGLGGGRGRAVPGRGVGRLTLAEACQTVGVPPEKACQILAKAGIPATPNQDMRELANAAGLRPGQLLRQIAENR